MAVYTEVGDEELEAFVAEYDIGEVVACKGIAEGVENSNFLLQTDTGAFILTLYEKRVNPDELPFFINLMEHLAAKGVSCPTPVHGRDGAALRELAGRPAAIVTFLKGLWPRTIHPFHCAELGRAMAEMHLAGADFGMHRANNLSVGGWRPLFEKCRARADEVAPGLGREIEDGLGALEAAWPSGLPEGVIHADLFPDNVFFSHDRCSGLIDFYFASDDMLAYDIAICLNAWCFERDGAFNVTKARLLLNNYGKVRPLSAAEVAAMPTLAAGAAMRFLLTRLYDWLNTPVDAFVSPKDPTEYLQKLRFHRSVTGPGDYGIDA